MAMSSVAAAEEELKGAQYADSPYKDSFHEQEVTSLHKALSVPHLHSKSSRNALTGVQSRKKTTEANPLPDPLLFAQLFHENQLLKDHLIKEEEEKKKQIIEINHRWDIQYNNLNQKYLAADQELKQLQEEIITKMKELVAKDNQISKLTTKLESFINNSCEDKEKALRYDHHEHCYSVEGQNIDEGIFETLRKTEKLMSEERAGRKMAMQQLQECKSKCEYLENTLSQQTYHRIYLQNELKHLSTAIENKATISGNEAQIKFANVVDQTNIVSNKDCFRGKEEVSDVELLKQQLQVYAEDFNAEKNEKRKLLVENEQLKQKINLFIEEKRNLLRQLQIYEEDFQREREKRINLLREKELSSSGNFPLPPVSSQSQAFPCPDENQQKWKEYCCLVVEREQISDRINELESQGVTRYNGRSSVNQGYESSLPSGRLPQTPSRQPPINNAECYDIVVRESRRP